MASDPTKRRISSDMILVGNAASIDGWDAETARALVEQSTTVPTGNGDAWMAPFALITFANKPEGQGAWAARTALRILSGTPPGQIPVVANKTARVTLNMPLAKKLGIRFPMELINQSPERARDEAGGSERDRQGNHETARGDTAHYD